jgi:hypothetical protein
LGEAKTRQVQALAEKAAWRPSTEAMLALLPRLEAERDRLIAEARKAPHGSDALNRAYILHRQIYDVTYALFVTTRKPQFERPWSLKPFEPPWPGVKDLRPEIEQMHHLAKHGGKAIPKPWDETPTNA